MPYTFGRKKRSINPADPLAEDDEYGLEEDQDEEGQEYEDQDELDEDQDDPYSPWAESQPEPQPQQRQPVQLGATDQLTRYAGEMPQAKSPSKWRRVLAGVAGGAMGFGGHSPEQIRKSARGILVPGYDEKMEQWREKGKALGIASDAETRQMEAQRRLAEHQARLKTEETQQGYYRGREAYYKGRANMPPAPEKVSPQQVLGREYQRQLNEAKTPEERQAVITKIEEQQKKAAPTQRLTRSEHWEGDTLVVEWSDPTTGEVVASISNPNATISPSRPPQESPGTAEDRQARRTKEQADAEADELVGKAYAAVGDDPVKARQWLIANEPDPRKRARALEKIRRPSSSNDRRADILKKFGITPGPSTPFGAGAGGAGNPYRKTAGK